MGKFDRAQALLWALFCGGTLFLQGCMLHAEAGGAAPQRQHAELVAEDLDYPFAIYDPLEKLNRRVYRFNYNFDRYVFLPAVRAYEAVLPDFAEERISNFVRNVFELRNLTNNLLQLKYKPAGVTLTRLLVNTTLGVAGFWDPASDIGLARQREDLGQTLGYYGVGRGPYIVLPLLGPSNLRDTFGLAGDGAAFALAGPPAWVDDTPATTAFTAVTAVDRRHRQAFRYFESGFPFEYEMVRMLYTEKREMEIGR